MGSWGHRQQWVVILNTAIVMAAAVVVAGLGAGGLGVRSEEERLMDYLFQQYNPSARPVINSTHTVNVNITFSLLHIQDLVSY